MPTSGTHITLVQRLALLTSDSRYPKLNPQDILGDPNIDGSDPRSRKSKFANLGAIGPDMFYMLADMGGNLKKFGAFTGNSAQDLENFLIKVEASFHSVAETMEEISRYTSGVEDVLTGGIASSLKETITLLSGAFSNITTDIETYAFSIWPFFEPARQSDLPRDQWYWGEYLHYVKTGDFTKRLLQNCMGNPNHKAYAYGYLTHYITDVVGHAYVNQIVQGPWRLHWQRHHLVENFIDAYVWDKWHKPMNPPKYPSVDEQLLDKVLDKTTPNQMGTGAPFANARLNDNIAIDGMKSAGALQNLLDAVADKFEKGLLDFTTAENTDAPPVTDNDLMGLFKVLENTLRDVYGSDPVHPKNLLNNDGFPNANDIASAYSVLQGILKLSTEQKVFEAPKAPDISADITAFKNQLLSDAQQILNDANALAGIVSSIGTNLSFDLSLDALINTIKNALNTALAIAQAFAKMIADEAALVGDTAAGLAKLGADAIKYALYLINQQLYALYKYTRDFLVLNAYSVPFTDELNNVQCEGVNFSDLWISKGNIPENKYPVEEFKQEENYLFDKSTPAKAPSAIAGFTTEFPVITSAGPYTAGSKPDAFIDSPIGPDDMFSAAGIVSSTEITTNKIRNRNYGGAIENCLRAFYLLQTKGLEIVLPNYNLDGDRGYGWPCWDISLNTSPQQFLNPFHDPSVQAKVTVLPHVI